LHPGSRTAAITFDISGTPAYRVRTVRNKEIWENVIDVRPGWHKKDLLHEVVAQGHDHEIHLIAFLHQASADSS
jgi:hypothetical protein